MRMRPAPAATTRDASSGATTHSPHAATGALMNQLLSASFNQDASCVAVSFPDPSPATGFQIFNCDPFGRFYSSASAATTGIGIAPAGLAAVVRPVIVEMLFCTSLVALVGESPRRLQIVNTKRDSTICELSFVSSILSVRLNRKRLVVVLEEHIYIYDIGETRGFEQREKFMPNSANMKLLHTIDTAPNPHGAFNFRMLLQLALTLLEALCALAPSSDNCFLAYPPSTAGGSSGDLLIFDAINLQAVNIIQAHKTSLSCIMFSFDGSIVATASDKGTVIRVFSVPNGQKLHQFRRGTYNATIYSLAFDLSNKYLAVSSDTDTVHIFKLESDSERKEREKRLSTQSASGGGTFFESVAAVSPPTSLDSAKKMIGGIVGTGLAAVRSPLASATSAVSSFLPNTITEIWEPQRDFAYAKLPQQTKGFQNMCALVGGAGLAGVTPLAGTATIASTGFDASEMTASMVAGQLQLVVLSACGFFHVFSVDVDTGGECVQQKEYSLLDD
ncbi:autophagy protein [Entophlyctis luteolus]|nr:autophagy protein [Entophlyctis luteolus]KAJ3350934.1 autophagy protein [Entophlyctis luteolus]KAJ3379972.1 autophagy protein [Entophlyctis sp. JEL0112]